MKRRILGLETEYGLACAGGRGRHRADAIARYLFDITGTAPPAGTFLENGGRLYLDSGFHPEFATPECDDLRELVVYDKAGERIIEELVRQAEEHLCGDGPRATAVVALKNNTDCVGNSYGCHENYLVSRAVPFGRLAEALIPFLVTRQVFAGAGKVLQTVNGFHYCLSQRAQHICQDVSASTTASRAIVNSRDEPHADAAKYRRLHLIIGDSNMSEVSTYLKVGTTALVLDMIEDGYAPRGCSLESPVRALRAISRDVTLSERVRLRDGRRYTALEVQKVYLESALGYIDAVGADAATRDVVMRWGHVIARLEQEPLSLSRELDWAIKFQWMAALMERERLDWSSPRVLLMDMQYHDLRRDRGIYNRLAARGMVDRITEDPRIEAAREIPPGTTRARLRGEFVRWARAHGQDYRVDWMYLRLNGEHRKIIRCEDPFQARDEEVERTIGSL